MQSFLIHTIDLILGYEWYIQLKLNMPGFVQIVQGKFPVIIITHVK